MEVGTHRELLEALPVAACPACASRPTLSDNPSDAGPCRLCGREPEKFVLIERCIVTSRQDVARALAAGPEGTVVLGPSAYGAAEQLLSAAPLPVTAGGN